MSANFAAATSWESATDTDRKPLKNLITELVGYPCKLACKPNNGSVDIFVFSDRKGRVVDWLEIQPSGAIGVVFDQYPNPDAKSVLRLSDACEDYNEKIGVSFESDSESESDSGSDSETDSSESETDEESDEADTTVAKHEPNEA
jgi:hypothetical protein